jgi:hypothetical protein
MVSKEAKFWRNIMNLSDLKRHHMNEEELKVWKSATL